MTNREKVAKVLETELPWMQGDLLKFADKIMTIFPTLSEELDNPLDGLFSKGFILGKTTERTLFECAREKIKAISDCKQALLSQGKDE
jgi:hypothetical protein